MFGDLPQYHFGANETFLNGKVTLHHGDCLDVLKQLQENSIDSCVTDPPYHLTSIVKRFSRTSESDDTVTSLRVRERADGYARLVATGFMGKVWDGGDIAFRPEVWREIYRVLKPGAHLLAMGGTRTYHRMVCAIEDAGFEIRDCIQWLYGSGFPKSHDVSKGIDRAAGAERRTAYKPNNGNAVYGSGMGGGEWNAPTDPPVTSEAAQWQGWGTALKPACELIVLARKPLSESTVAANVLKWGTGAINVDGCRVPCAPDDKGDWPITQRRHDDVTYTLAPVSTDRNKGRWPANVIHDGSEEVVGAFPADLASGQPLNRLHVDPGRNVASGASAGGIYFHSGFGDSGSAARFFYTAKADSDDRIGSKHPTVKPLDLMQYLVRLITPPGGLVLDPFAGTGTTGEAAWREGMRAVLIERDEEYCADIRRRMVLALSGPDERARESIKAKNLPRDDGPLFAFAESQYDGADDFAKSIDECYRVIRERKANGGPGWPREPDYDHAEALEKKEQKFNDLLREYE